MEFRFTRGVFVLCMVQIRLTHVFVDRLSTVASFYLQGSYAAWASTAFGQGELLVACGKLQRRTVARGSDGVDHDCGILLEVCHCLVCFAMRFFCAISFDTSFSSRFAKMLLTSSREGKTDTKSS